MEDRFPTPDVSKDDDYRIFLLMPTIPAQSFDLPDTEAIMRTSKPPWLSCRSLARPPSGLKLHLPLESIRTVTIVRKLLPTLLFAAAFDGSDKTWDESRNMP
jgi:hypothetical protein